MPFNSCTAFVEFASNADPNSVVFSASRDTITRRKQDTHQSILKPDTINQVKSATNGSVCTLYLNQTRRDQHLYEIVLLKELPEIVSYLDL